MVCESSGIVVIDKPAGMSSAQVVAAVKRTLRARKVGHAGTLDPLATGVLVCLVNRATRLAGHLLEGEKTYAATLCLGQTTDTQDATGRVLERAAEGSVRFSGREVRAAFARFSGAIRQRPPAYSALKQNGVPLYRLARRGRPVQKPARAVVISALEVTEVALPRVRFTVVCSAGTYVRTLCADVGDVLGCGGHLTALRRLASSGFGIAEALTLEAFAERVARDRAGWGLIPMTRGLPGVAAFTADARLTARVRHGQSPDDLVPDAAAGSSPGGLLQVVTPAGDLIALLRRRNDGRSGYRYCAVFDPVGGGGRSG